jgi:site-specific DNA recombinase
LAARPVKAAIYCRISRDRVEITEGGEKRFTMLGVERQELDCRIKAASLGWEVAETFVDNDISATSGRTRPGYEAMLAAIENGTIHAIICWHPDRLYRRAVDLERLVSVCDKAHAPIATVNAGDVDLTTPSGRLVAGLLAQVSKYEGEHKAERWVRSFQQRREAGTPTGGGRRMYGWDRQGVVDGLEANNIVFAAESIIAGKTVQQVADALNAAGARTTMGNRWRPAALRGLLTNPRLKGATTLYGEVVSDVGWPAILRPEVWDELQAALAAQKRQGNAPRVSWLLGLAKCSVCGSVMKTGSRVPGTRTYKCPRFCTEIGAEPFEAYVREEVMHDDPFPAEVVLRANLAREAITTVWVDPFRGRKRWIPELGSKGSEGG